MSCLLNAICVALLASCVCAQCPSALYFHVSEVSQNAVEDMASTYLTVDAENVMDCVKKCRSESQFCFSVGFFNGTCKFSYLSEYNCTKRHLIVDYNGTSPVLVNCIRCPEIGEMGQFLFFYDFDMR